MRTIVFTFSIVLVGLHLQGQELLFERDINLSSVFRDKRESLPIINSDSSLTLFLLDHDDIVGLRFSKDFKLIDSIIVERIDGKNNLLVGHSADKQSYNLFFANKNRSQFTIKNIDFENKTSRIMPLKLEFKKEKYLEAFSYNGKFYVLTVRKMSSVLNIFEFDGKVNLNKRVVDLSEYEFARKGYFHLYDIFLDEEVFPKQVLKITKIESHNPNPLDIASAENKLYCFNGNLLLTVDNEDDNTKLISIDLNYFSSEVVFIDQGYIKNDDNSKTKSNSYLVDNILYQIRASKEELFLRGYSLMTKSLVFEQRVSSGEEICFANTPLFQEGGTTIFTQNSERELNKSKQFLRRMVAGDVGISVYSHSNKLVLTVGGYQHVQNSGGGGPYTMHQGTNSMATPYGTIASPQLNTYNPTAFGYNTYKNTRSVYFKTLISAESGLHLEGDVEKNAFDKIEFFEGDFEGFISSETIFKIGDTYIFGFYDKTEKKYFLRGFGDGN